MKAHESSLAPKTLNGGALHGEGSKGYEQGYTQVSVNVNTDSQLAVTKCPTRACWGYHADTEAEGLMSGRYGLMVSIEKACADFVKDSAARPYRASRPAGVLSAGREVSKGVKP